MNSEVATAIQVIDISSQEIRTYKEYSRSPNLRRALRRFDKVARDRQALMALGDNEAVEGATIELPMRCLTPLPSHRPASRRKRLKAKQSPNTLTCAIRLGWSRV